ncbi:MAG: DUF1853 family protein [Flavobacteriales bacterium]|nr:DUF1853 family protein [Flavobacteriales bacterium]
MNSIFSTYQLDGKIKNFNIKLDRSVIDHNSALPLGKKAELALARTLENNDRYELIAHGLQIFQEKRTIGEIDFIIKDLHTKSLIHLEFVYKFYLFIPWIGQFELEHWIGPNFKDRLTYKLEKLRQHQFPIIYQKEATEPMTRLGLEVDKLQQGLCFLAELYVPLDVKDIKFTKVDKGCVQGTWSTLDSFFETTSSNERYYVCEKTDWLKSPNENMDWYDKKQVLDIVRSQLERGNSPMIWIKGSKFISKHFVIPNRPRTNFQG